MNDTPEKADADDRADARDISQHYVEARQEKAAGDWDAVTGGSRKFGRLRLGRGPWVRGANAGSGPTS